MNAENKSYKTMLRKSTKINKQLKQKYKLKDNNDIATKAIRLCLEYRDWETPNAYFLTLTIDDKSYKQLKDYIFTG